MGPRQCMEEKVDAEDQPRPGERCGSHPASPSVATCPRCGAYACGACWSADARCCRACVAAGHDARPIAWERSGRLGLVVTLRDILGRPSTFFGALPNGPIWRPLILAFTVWASFLAPSVVLLASSGLRIRPFFWLEAAGITLGAAGAATLIVLALTAPLAHLVASTRGGRAGGRLTMRACLYLQAYAVVGLACLLLAAIHVARQSAAGYVPPVHPERDRAFVVLGFLVALIPGTMAARHFALGRQRLSRFDAWVFALLPAGAVAAAALGVIAAIRSEGAAIVELIRRASSSTW